MNDTNTTIQTLRDKTKKFATDRNWERFLNLRALAISLSLEANEFLDHFQWLSDKEVEEIEKNTEMHKEFAEELSDILAYIFHTANRLNIDIADAFLKKLEKNAQKYPVEEFSDDKSWEEDNKKYQELRKEWDNKN